MFDLRTFLWYYVRAVAEVAELADAADSKSAAPKERAGSTPAFGTSYEIFLLPDLFGEFFIVKYPIDAMKSSIVLSGIFIFIHF